MSVKFQRRRTTHHAVMQHRTIPIRTVPQALPEAVVEPPRLDGNPEDVQWLVRELQSTVDVELGVRLPAGAWLRELRLKQGECVVALAPGLRQRGNDVAQAAFTTLRRLLNDTDIYVGAAA